ncbi:hypothetical protein DERP_005383 [Dermatophagoides pteronyssinus]|uniref:Uncharacterized protein n=1 Tax=Dermatophagoides pteronyssinus TaxID=6956 RepID=A0ABQ8JMG5_DERPT|nr:hypothetical protein DERP_005383 [Dermatophagoides pteronyssinus]
MNLRIMKDQNNKDLINVSRNHCLNFGKKCLYFTEELWSSFIDYRWTEHSTIFKQNSEVMLVISRFNTVDGFMVVIVSSS